MKVIPETYSVQRDEFEDTEGVIRICKSKMEKQYNDQRKRTKDHTTIYKALHRKLKIEQHETH